VDTLHACRRTEHACRHTEHAVETLHACRHCTACIYTNCTILFRGVNHSSTCVALLLQLLTATAVNVRCLYCHLCHNCCYDYVATTSIAACALHTSTLLLLRCLAIPLLLLLLLQRSCYNNNNQLLRILRLLRLVRLLRFAKILQQKEEVCSRFETQFMAQSNQYLVYSTYRQYAVTLNTNA
jgi:hypothetical protein